MSLLFIGIDNGIDGGLCALGPLGDVIGYIKMPVLKRKVNEIDILLMKRWIYEISGFKADECRIIIEEPGGSKSARAATSMARSFGSIRGALAWGHLIYRPITPQSWQSKMLGKTEGQSKKLARQLAWKLWPGEDFIPPKCRTPHDGIIDAALIAEYGRTHLTWTRETN